MFDILFIVSLAGPPLALLAGIVVLLMPIRSRHASATQPAETVRA